MQSYIEDNLSVIIIIVDMQELQRNLAPNNGHAQDPYPFVLCTEVIESVYMGNILCREVHWTKSRISLCVTTYILALSCIYPAEHRAKFPTKCSIKLDRSFRFPTIRKYYFSPSGFPLSEVILYRACTCREYYIIESLSSFRVSFNGRFTV